MSLIHTLQLLVIVREAFHLGLCRASTSRVFGKQAFWSSLNQQGNHEGHVITDKTTLKNFETESTEVQIGTVISGLALHIFHDMV